MCLSMGTLRCVCLSPLHFPSASPLHPLASLLPPPSTHSTSPVSLACSCIPPQPPTRPYGGRGALTSEICIVEARLALSSKALQASSSCTWKPLLSSCTWKPLLSSCTWKPMLSSCTWKPMLSSCTWKPCHPAPEHTASMPGHATTLRWHEVRAHPLMWLPLTQQTTLVWLPLTQQTTLGRKARLQHTHPSHLAYAHSVDGAFTTDLHGQS